MQDTNGWTAGGMGHPRKVPGYRQALNAGREYRPRREQVEQAEGRAWEQFKAAFPHVVARGLTPVPIRCPRRHVLFTLSLDMGESDPFGPWDYPQLTASAPPTWKWDADDVIRATAPGAHVPGVLRETYGEPGDEDYAERDAGPAVGTSALRTSAHITISCPKCAEKGRHFNSVHTRVTLMRAYLTALVTGQSYATLE